MDQKHDDPPLPNPSQLRAMARPAPCMPGRHCERHASGLRGCIAGECNRPKPGDGVKGLDDVR
ncbi:hypothetical protein JJ685_05430 [Ramlibacter monticola]|uniref:Uncharacterized protein n=1 Tax=Ramlibacter monticola TaxID=1926872 RepID=A0A936YZ19_9BURK|nr:hypothetical protein [Ramlibacter monticola]MBL0390580.1 hypothetical protein [Ramlibacter monticola]